MLPRWTERIFTLFHSTLTNPSVALPTGIYHALLDKPSKILPMCSNGTYCGGPNATCINNPPDCGQEGKDCCLETTPSSESVALLLLRINSMGLHQSAVTCMALQVDASAEAGHLQCLPCALSALPPIPSLLVQPQTCIARRAWFAITQVQDRTATRARGRANASAGDKAAGRAATPEAGSAPAHGPMGVQTAHFLVLPEQL